MATKTFTAQGMRIQDLCEKIVTVYDKDDIKRLISFDPYTLQRCAQRVNVLRTGNAMALAAILAVKDQSLKDYYENNITLDELWSRRSEAPRVSIISASTYHDILYSAKNLTAAQRLEIVKSLLETLTLDIADPNLDSIVELSESSKKRLKTLLSESMRFGKKTVKDLIEAGCNAPALTDILSNFDRQYNESAYESILPFLYSALEWIDDETMITAYPSKLTTIDDLWNELNHI